MIFFFLKELFLNVTQQNYSFFAFHGCKLQIPKKNFFFFFCLKRTKKCKKKKCLKTAKKAHAHESWSNNTTKKQIL